MELQQTHSISSTMKMEAPVQLKAMELAMTEAKAAPEEIHISMHMEPERITMIFETRN